MFVKFHKIFDSLTEKERQIFQGTALVLAVALILNGVNLFYKETTLAPIEGGNYTEGLVGQPIAINPLIAGSNDVDHDLIGIVFRDLLELTESHKISDDKKSWTIKIKENLLWSDGKPLSANDVIFTLATIQNPDTNSPLFSSWQGVSAERASEREIKFTLKTPYAFFLENLKNLKVVPRHIFGNIPAANLRISDYNFEPVGNGPYAFTGFTKRKDGFITEYNFSANKFYEGEAPLIKELKFKFFTSYDDATLAFNRKEIDGLGGIGPADVEKLKIGHELFEINIPRYYAVFFNPGTTEVIKNDDVRTALLTATDREKIISEILKNYGLPIYGPIYPSLEGYGSTAENQKFSLEKAREILEKDNWSPGEDGILTKKTRAKEQKLDFEIIVPKIDFLEDTVKIIAADWEKIGVKLTPIILSSNEVASDVIKTRNYQMIIFGNILKSSPDVFSFWHSSERFYPGLNLSLYENRKVDNLLESIRVNHNESSRAKDIKELQEIIHKDKPAIFLYSPHYLYAGPKNLGGFNSKLITNASQRFSEINKWYLKTARVFK